MALLSVIFFGFLGICAIVACFRSAKILIKGINGVFDKVEDKIGR